MRSLVLCVIASLGSVAAAQPVTSPSSCSVTIVRAPDDVRQIVDDWIRSEPRCATALEVRIVAGDSGLYVVARDDRGAIRDRVVPDARTAGALIASWAADDAEPPREPEPTRAPRLPAIALPAALPAPGVEVAAQVRQAPSPHWLGVFGMRSTTGANGVRAEVDLVTGSAVTAGLAFGVETSGLDGWSGTTPSRWSELGARVYLSHAIRRGPWEARPSIGAGVVRRASDDGMPGSGAAIFAPIGEAAFAISRDLTGNLALSIGVVVTGYGKQFDSPAAIAGVATRASTADPSTDSLGVALATGLRWRM